MHTSRVQRGGILQLSMKINPQIVLASLHLLIFLGMVSTLVAQMSSAAATEPKPALNADQIVQKMVLKNLERARALEAYSGTRVYRLEYRGFPSSRSAEITVDVRYRSPATKEFSIRSESGSHFLVEKVFQRMMQSEKEALLDDNQTRIALNNDNYRFILAWQESLPTGLAYVLMVEPRTSNKLLYRGRIWVDAEDFAVVRIEASPAKNPSFWTKETKIEQAYTKVGNFWLPVSNRSTSAIRLGGHAYFTIDYRDYKITAEAPLSTSSRAKGY